MDSLWYKDDNINKRKRHALHSLGVGFVFFVILYILTKIFSVSLCPIKTYLGFSCLGCGMTRGFISILNLEFAKAIKYNVLSIPLFFGIVIYFILCIIDILLNKNFIFNFEKFLSKKYMFIVYILIIIVAYIFNNR